MLRQDDVGLSLKLKRKLVEYECLTFYIIYLFITLFIYFLLWNLKGTITVNSTLQ